MDRRNRVDDSPMTFINKGYLLDNMNNGALRSASRLGDHRNSHTVPNGQAEHEAGRGSSASDATTDRDIFRGITELVRRDVQHENNREAKVTSYHNGLIIFLTIVILLTPIAISGYVYWKHERNTTLPCPAHGQGPSISPSKQQSDYEYLRLKELAREVKKLQENYHEMRKNIEESQGGLSIREQRKILKVFPTFKSKERQQADRDKGKETHHQSEDLLEEELSNRIQSTEKNCLDMSNRLSGKIQKIDRKLDKANNNCVFKTNNSTEVDNATKKRKVQLTEHKNAYFQFVGVTCCNENTTSNLVNGILKVKETTANITYACYCPMAQKCSICYWECGQR